jgi:hypothetical protein
MNVINHIYREFDSFFNSMEIFSIFEMSDVVNYEFSAVWRLHVILKCLDVNYEF